MRPLSILSWCPALRTLVPVMLPESRFDEKDQAHQSGAGFD